MKKINRTLPAEETMRRAIATRDTKYDSRFVYAVVTTGVVCRPSCAARPAKPENVRFFTDVTTAAEAGFRPCKRCRPDDELSKHERMVKVARFIEQHYEQRLTLADLGTRFGMSGSQLQRNFKAALGVSPREYQDEFRKRRFHSLLKQGEDVTDATYAAGFGSSSRIYGDAAHNIGMTPRAYRDGGAGETIYYVCRDTSLGLIMMAATARGVCFAQFGDSQSGLLKTLAGEFPQATLAPSSATNSPQLTDWIEALNKHLSDDCPRPDLPLDLRGTAFQIKVWRYLLSINEGDVVSYAEVASGIGKPKAFRAAATACGANRVAVLVPCHRVLRGDGSIGGYRWGVDRKRVLLDAERASRAAK